MPLSISTWLGPHLTRHFSRTKHPAFRAISVQQQLFKVYQFTGCTRHRPVPASSRAFSISPSSFESQKDTPVSDHSYLEQATYHGPLTTTFRRLKMFSLTSLGLSFAMTPFILIIQSSLPTVARVALAFTAISTSSISTLLVTWCCAPYVTELRRSVLEDGTQVLEMTTLTLSLKKIVTRVYDSDFLAETRRPFAKWELAEQVSIPAAKAGTQGQEETIAESFNSKGDILGRWVVVWGENGSGTCRASGKIVRYFNVHEEMLS